MRSSIFGLARFASVSTALGILHIPYIGLPYFWDEAGYYIPAARDVYAGWNFVPVSTLPTGHTPLVMTYLALAWRCFGVSAVVTRVALMLLAAGTVLATYALARRLVTREAAVWSALLLAVSPLFFAQSTLVFLDLPAALFTTLALLALVRGHLRWFALVASLAVLTKETAVVILPVAWVYAWQRARTSHPSPWPQAEPELKGQDTTLIARWFPLLIPIAPLLAWTFYYHYKTGFWTGNAEYLQYNLYTTLDPARFFWTVLRRLYEVFVAGCNWLITLGAVAGWWWGRKRTRTDTRSGSFAQFTWVVGGLIGIYVVLLSLVGGAVLPRYLLPVFPAFYVLGVGLMGRLPKIAFRSICGVAAAGFIAAWFINPPYPFAYENNLAYADFIRLHQDAARYLQARPAGERILTGWPATDELSRPFLGYVEKPLHTVPLEGFTARDFEKVMPESFDAVYLYSRKWEPPTNWLERLPFLLDMQRTYFDYSPQVPDRILVDRYGLLLEQEFYRRGQWVRIYSRQPLDR